MSLIARCIQLLENQHLPVQREQKSHVTDVTCFFESDISDKQKQGTLHWEVLKFSGLRYSCNE